MNAAFDGRGSLEAYSEFLGEEDVFPVTDTLGASTMDALDTAHWWLEQAPLPPQGQPEPGGEVGG